MIDLLLRAGLVLAGLAYLTLILLSPRSARPGLVLSLLLALLAFGALAGDYFYAFLIPTAGIAWRLAKRYREDDAMPHLLTVGLVCLGLAWFFVALPDLGRFVPMLPADSPADSYDLARIAEDFRTNPVAVPLVSIYGLLFAAALFVLWRRRREQGERV